MNVITNLHSFEQALRDNFKGVNNKNYIRDSITWHMKNRYITPEEANKLREEYL